MQVFVVHNMICGGEERFLEVYSNYYMALTRVARYVGKHAKDISYDLKIRGILWNMTKDVEFTDSDNVYVHYKCTGQTLHLCWGDSKDDITFAIDIVPVTVDSNERTYVRKGTVDGRLHPECLHD